MALDPLPTFPKEEYGKLAPRVAGVDRTYPSKRGWGPGWPDCQPGKLDNTQDVKRPSDGQGFNRPVRKELVELFGFLMQSTMDLGYEFRTNDEQDGGVSTYNCRAIKGSNPPAPSWHSWGLAIDINSSGNPQFHFRSTQPPWMVDLWESSGFYWGGRYKEGFQDAMHFEYCFRPEDVATDLANAHAAFERIRAQLIGDVANKVADVPPNGDSTVTPQQVTLLQQFLNESGANPKLLVDGVFGPVTEAAMKQVGQLIRSQRERLAAARQKAQEIAAL